jgi:hypothetical protein
LGLVIGRATMVVFAKAAQLALMRRCLR